MTMPKPGRVRPCGCSLSVPCRGHRSHPGDGKNRATIDRFGTKTLKVGHGWTRIWGTSGETYMDVGGNGP